ncbi:hypothetical protein N018_12385 [Pseudomonas syringae CC1557]|uniref:Uncharacterized protein n=1 Tax=Pseudomonas syringae CC1557 TaxID=1357279 RepID=W0MYR7_PSESX|nr:hypothetical protein N018_12385 [Pseudomonas syringae CC1557]
MGLEWLAKPWKPLSADDAARQGNDAIAVDDRMPLAAELTAIGRIRADAS